MPCKRWPMSDVCLWTGMAMYYSDKIFGVPPVLRKHVAAFPVLHAVNFFVTNRSALHILPDRPPACR